MRWLLYENWRPRIAEREADRDRSARNLLQYLALRRHDLRDAQYRLTELGLSSMADTEGHVQASVDAVLTALQSLVNDVPRSAPIGFAGSRQLLAQQMDVGDRWSRGARRLPNVDPMRVTGSQSPCPRGHW
jgi:hypothetical protein